MFAGRLFGPCVLLLLLPHTSYLPFVLKESKAEILNGVSHSCIPSCGPQIIFFS